ncbi:cobalamin biosynthesis protein CbiX [Kitasatospora sp. NPDC096140]|uniref:sirohydrochlorin chelatase n=1 Tax=Kitasatospora sp. NPDC096140 TaxID=3155425 RepID=UPI00332EB100
MTRPQSATVVLAGGHESDGGRDLAPLVAADPAVHAAAPAGRPLAEAVRRALAADDRPVCVVPMTLGRDPRLVADSARALRWLAAGEGRGRLALAAPFGAAEHLIGWLRAAARTAPDGALLVTAPTAGPFEDAELFRIARLVRQYGQHRWVEVAFEGGDPDPAEGAERCRLLGAREVTAVPASFGPALRAALPGVRDGTRDGAGVGSRDGAGVGSRDGAGKGSRDGTRDGEPAVAPAGIRDGGPLLRPSAIAGVIAARTAAALHTLGHGEDGIRAGLDAEHGHGYPHSHGPGAAHHPHGHPHPGQHPHRHHPHAPAHTPH